MLEVLSTVQYLSFDLLVVFSACLGDMKYLNNYYELLCVYSSAKVAVPITTTGGALSLHILRGAAGRQLDLLTAIDLSYCLN